MKPSFFGHSYFSSLHFGKAEQLSHKTVKKMFIKIRTSKHYHIKYVKRDELFMEPKILQSLPFLGGHYVIGLGVMFEHLGFTETFKEGERER